jgi:hypothetical protein
MNSGNHSPTSYLISIRNSKSTSDKVDLIISTLEDIVNTFKARGCPEGKELLREILLRNHLFGDTDGSGEGLRNEIP